MKQPIRVILADDHKMFIDGVHAFLKETENIEILDIAHNGEDVLKLLKKYHTVDVLVLDINMPKMDGIEVTKEIKKIYPKTQILIVSMHDKRQYIIELMRLGIAGYVLKDKSSEQLVNAIYNVSRGQTHFSLDILDKIRTIDLVDREKVLLTEREEEVLCCIADGLSSQKIAEKLFISVSTVHVHRKHLLKKTGKENAAQLVRYAIRHGYIDA